MALAARRRQNSQARGPRYVLQASSPASSGSVPPPGMRREQPSFSSCELTRAGGLYLTGGMRLSVLICCAGLLAGCASRHRNVPPSAQAPPSPGAAVSPVAPKNHQGVIVTPGHATTGRVAAVNAPGRFVVLTFPLGAMPALEKRLNVYHGGLKVGEVKVTGPQLDINIDADVIAGECQVGDEVREQ